MRVEIVRVADVDSGAVEFRCDAGTALGYWEGTPPSVGESADVEVDVPEDVTDWVTRGVASGGGLRTVGDGVRSRVTGTVEEVGDPVVVLRVGSEVILVDFVGEGPPLEVGSVVEFLTSRIRLFPTNL